MTNDTLVVYGIVKVNDIPHTNTLIEVKNIDSTKIRTDFTSSTGKFQLDCTFFDEGELCLLSTCNKIIQFKADSSKTPYRIDILSHDVRVTDTEDVEVC